MQPEAAPAIQVEGLYKQFRIPTHKIDSFKERIVRPFSARDFRELQALDGVSFEVGQGEFFGIVGRNGSGKSTLLKILASIYRSDAGRVLMAGRLAPFIELGVGFNHELTARENVVLNGVMMGLTPQETRDRLDAVLEFAELEEFVDLKLKNYSSGMLVRLAFSVMLEADADILLIDEVLAVGDAAFQQKCADAFREMKSKDKTLVLVTHDMSTVEEYCDRAMLIDDGQVKQIGDPAEIGRRYLRLNFERGVDLGDGSVPSSTGEVKLGDAWLENEDGERVTSFEHGRDIRLRVDIEVVHEVAGLSVGFMIVNADGVAVCEFGTSVTGPDGSETLREGERVRVGAKLDNRLTSGRYFVHSGINRENHRDTALYVHNAMDFVVFGDEGGRGIVSLGHEIDAVTESARQPS